MSHRMKLLSVCNDMQMTWPANLTGVRGEGLVGLGCESMGVPIHSRC